MILGTRSGSTMMMGVVLAACWTTSLFLLSASSSVDAWIMPSRISTRSTQHGKRTTSLITTTTTVSSFPFSSSSSSSSTQLHAQRKKNGGLGTLAKEGLLGDSNDNDEDAESNAAKNRRLRREKSQLGRSSSSSSSSAAKKKVKAAISPALAEWMKTQDESSTEGQEEASAAAPTTTVTTTSVSATTTTAATFEAFPDEDEEEDDEASSKPSNKKKGGKKSDRRVKQSQRTEQDEQLQAQMDAAVGALEEALDGTKKNNLEEILEAVQGLLSVSASSSSNPRLLLGGKQRYDYRLAWVGSDDAICHVGTGLHKVPLARLQEVFWSCLGKNRVEILEVISILGPFPNVRNTLQGNTKLLKNNNENDDEVTTLNIVMDSMIDGTGKEIMAGKEDNVRRVDLQLYFANERAMVAVVPPEDGSRRANPLEENGSNVLVWLREENLDDRLDALRVS